MTLPPGSTPGSRCPWAAGDALMAAYHDAEWGVPVHDDRKMFEFLVLESAQAGLSWLTILRRREGYRRAFADFDAERVAGYEEADILRLLGDPGIIRNRRKVEAAIGNARVFLDIQQERGSFCDYLWDFVEGRPVVNRWQTPSEMPATSALSDRISKELIRRGFRFFGSTICYAHLQATGVINDHLVGCFRYGEVD